MPIANDSDMAIRLASLLPIENFLDFLADSWPVGSKYAGTLVLSEKAR
jgi:hypothetical protein